MPECIKNEDGNRKEEILRDIIYVAGMKHTLTGEGGKDPPRIFFFFFGGGEVIATDNTYCNSLPSVWCLSILESWPINVGSRQDY